MDIKLVKDPQKRLAELWIPNGIPDAIIKSCMSSLQEQHYHVVLYRSGQQDLVQCTQQLLQNNF